MEFYLTTEERKLIAALRDPSLRDKILEILFSPEG